MPGSFRGALYKRASRSRIVGFTLVEILIVLVIIAILAAILLPVFMKVRESARAATCAGNLKQMGLAIQLYAADYNGFLPNHLPPDFDCSWVDQIHPYVKAPAIFECPSADAVAGEYRPGCSPSKPIEDPFGDSEPKEITYNGSYDINALGEKDKRVRESSLRYPSSTILVLDGKGSFVNPDKDDVVTIKSLTERGVSTRHNGGANVLFADSHVKWMSLETLAKRSLWSGEGKD